MTDYTVSRLENCTCWAVILFKADFCYIEIFFKIDDVLIVCSTPGINRLVVVSYDGYVLVGKQVHHFILLMACVLEFVYHEVFIAFTVALKNLGELAEKFDWKNYEIIKVYGVV